MKLRHLPTVVDAVEWDDSDEARAELVGLGFELGIDGYLEPTATGGGPRTLMIRTLDGESAIPAIPGQSWIVHPTDGEWYPVSNAVRYGRYEEAVS